MTIASQIQDYADGLTAAYNMVSQRGGTIPQRKNMDNLPTAIATIPSGGQQIKDYGTVLVAPLVAGYGPTSEYGCSVIIDSATFAANMSTYTASLGPLPWLLQYSSSYDYWEVNYNGHLTSADLSILGVTVVRTESYPSFYIESTTIPDVNNPVQKQLTDEYEYMSLGQLFKFGLGTPLFSAEDADLSFLCDGEKKERRQIVGYTFGADCNYVPDYFLAKCVSLNSNISLPSGITKVPNYFLYGCISFNSSVTIPNTVTEIGDYFMSGCISVTSLVQLPSSVTKLGNNFMNETKITTANIPGTVTTIGTSCLSGCTSLTSVTLNDGIQTISSRFCSECTSLTGFSWSGVSTLTSIGSYFLYGCSNMNAAAAGNVPSSVLSISEGFLRACSSFNNPVTVPSVATLGAYFLGECSSFNSSVTFSSPTTKFGTGFLYKCTSFNQPITLPSSTTSIGSNFLQGCTAFNQDLTFPSTLKSLMNYFLDGCSSFNKSISLSGMTSVGSYFLRSCTAFDKPISIPSTVTTLSGYFLYGCTSFNSTLTIETRTSTLTMGSYFMWGCTSFAQPLTLSSYARQSTYFMYNCNNFVGPLTVYNTSNMPSGNYSLATSSSTATMYTSGVVIMGSARSNWISALPNRTSTPYRKLIDGGA